jgi:outer membrane protein OmpA-like peptidoglycan-associated protein
MRGAMKYRTLLARGLGLAVFAPLALAPLASCGGAQRGAAQGCNYGTWQGQCRLVSVRTARTIERFPRSFVVLEASYEPQMTEGVLSPPGFKREFTTPAGSEGELENHLKQNGLVQCQIQPPATDSCAPPMLASIPTFIPHGAAGGPSGPIGCAKIERSGNAPIPSTAVLPGPFQFEQMATTSTPEIEQMADQAAAKIKADPKIECVAIKGKNAPGEPFMLANDRAQLVKRLLEQRGIDKTRVTVFEATAPAYTANPNEEQPVAHEQRRVYLSVVVYGNP